MSRKNGRPRASPRVRAVVGVISFGLLLGVLLIALRKVGQRPAHYFQLGMLALIAGGIALLVWSYVRRRYGK